jgi:hypothetical protein
MRLLSLRYAPQRLAFPSLATRRSRICACDVQEGANLATVECDKVKPSTDANDARTVYSQYALTQFQQGRQALKCASGTPWTWWNAATCNTAYWSAAPLDAIS